MQFPWLSHTISQISFNRSDRVGLHPPIVRNPLIPLVINEKAFNWKGNSGPKEINFFYHIMQVKFMGKNYPRVLICNLIPAFYMNLPWVHEVAPGFNSSTELFPSPPATTTNPESSLEQPWTVLVFIIWGPAVHWSVVKLIVHVSA